uniref:beta-glucosidase n=1 Tax=Candidatus Fimenecus sp. TaxID=3022888 RepID=UPI004026E348
MEDILKLLRELTTEEKAALVAGTDFMYTNPVPRLDISQVRMSDGPHGLRVQQQGGDNGIAGSEPATAFPTAALTACGWNEDNLCKMGQAIGAEARHYGINVVLGPGVNIKRNPLAGRNFEYFSEDPLLAGKMGAAEINGIQSRGVGVSLKHFALNNAENYRFMGDSVCDERAMREIYLKAFEIAVKAAKPETVMCAYNKISGTYCRQTFDYSDMKVEENDDGITVSATITNTGSRFGAEIVELYVKAPKTDVYKPEKELRGFTKVYLDAGESKEIKITVNKSDLAYYNVKEKRYVLERGEYEFQLCSDCETVKLSEKIKINGENVPSPYDKQVSEIYENSPDKVSDEAFEKTSGLKIPSLPPVKPITLESRFTDLQKTFMGKIIFNAVLSVAKKDMKKALKLPDGRERDNKIKGAMFLKRILESNSIITMSMSAGKSCPYHFAQGFVDLANGRIIKGIKDFCSPVKAAALPKNQNDRDKE